MTPPPPIFALGNHWKGIGLVYCPVGKRQDLTPSLLLSLLCKIIVFGEVDKELAAALEAFAKFQITLAKPRTIS